MVMAMLYDRVGVDGASFLSNIEARFSIARVVTQQGRASY
jgi:hypothetical protein